MKELSLDEYRLMMGAQLWLKESFFSFLETLFGGKSTSSPESVSKLDGELSRLTEELFQKTRKTTKPKINKELNKINEKLRSKVSKADDMQTGKQESEATRTKGDGVDLSNWSVLVHDNSQKRDEKVNSLNEKIKNYGKRGYIK
jgi:hypothetical protein